MPKHDIELVAEAIDLMLVNEREARDAEKAEQYGSKKTSFYPSELGDGDRKIVYGFFKEHFPQDRLSGQNVRVFDNGDYVHLRYRDYMIRLGALLTEEQSLKIDRNDFERRVTDSTRIDGPMNYRVSGRYDQIIDLNVIRAYLEGIEAWQSFLQTNYEAHEIITTTLDATAGAILEEKKSTRWFPKADYTPDPMVIDVKSMNPWGFKAIDEKNDYSDIQGYLDQVNAYEDKLNIYKGGLLVEDKEKNRLKGVPVDYDPERISGGEVHEGLRNRLARLWNHVLEGTVPAERCDGATISKFPCKWSTGQCRYFSHCWNDEHQGLTIPGLAPVAQADPEPELPSIEELIDYLTNPDTYKVSAIILYLENFPGGQDRFVLQGNMPPAMIEQMLDYYADYVHNLDYVDMEGNVMAAEGEAEAQQEAATASEKPLPTKEEVKAMTDEMRGVAEARAEEEAAEGASDSLVNPDGTFNFEPGASVVERVRTDGNKEINCGKCGNLIIYKVLRGAKECPTCKHKNVVTRA